MRLLGFEWNDENRAKLETHDLEPDDVEWLFDQGEPVVFDHPTRRGRLVALGFAPDGRFLVVVFSYETETRWVRVVTAYEAEHERWWKIYRKASAG
jgi:uncharacterized DUF497 family protein